MKFLNYGKLEDEGEGERHYGGTVAKGESDAGFEHRATERVAAGGCAGLVLVGLAVRFLFAFGGADLPCAPIGCIFCVTGGCACDGDECTGLVDKAVDFLLNGDDEHVTVR